MGDTAYVRCPYCDAANDVPDEFTGEISIGCHYCGFEFYATPGMVVVENNDYDPDDDWFTVVNVC